MVWHNERRRARQPPSCGRTVSSRQLTQRAVITQYCQGCHNDRVKSGGMSVQALEPRTLDQSAELAEEMIRKLRAGMMPPAGAPRPDAATLKALTRSLETTLDRAAAAHPNPGWRTFQRLNRSEYARSVRDLLSIDVDVAALLPPDTLSAGFDNIADSQSFSPAVMEGYMRAAGKIVNDALGDPAASPTSVTYNVPSTVSQMRHVDGAPVGTRGGISVVHNVQADGAVRLQHQAASRNQRRPDWPSKPQRTNRGLHQWRARGIARHQSPDVRGNW